LDDVMPALPEGYPHMMSPSQRHRGALRLTLIAAALALGCASKDRVGADQPTTKATKATKTDAGTTGRDAMASAGGSSGAGGKPSAMTDAGKTGAGKAGAGGTKGGSADAGGDAARGDAAASGQGAEDADCDMNGIWVARLTTFSRDDVVQAVQTASNWFYYEITQQGRDLTISAALNCGIQVSGSADVTINRATTTALMKRNDQSGRRGQFYKDGDHCVLTVERFYNTRGVPRAVYLPSDLSSKPALSSITPALPTMQSPAGNEDWDGDGHPGIAFNAANLGTRHVVQRDWNEFFSDDSHKIALGATEFVAAASFDNQEQILETGGSLGGLLLAGSMPAFGLSHRISWKRLGKDTSEAAVAAVRVSDDLTTCFNVQAALPHDSSSM
jgi:hypothetical protein